MDEKTAAKKIFYRFFSSWHGLLLLLSVSFLYFLFGITGVVDVYDEGIPVYGAERILNGEVPYRDFWTIYAPGQFYVLAGLFKIFGSSLLAERLYDTAVRALVSGTVYLIALRLASPGWGLLFWLVVTAWLKFFGYHASSTFPAILFALVSLWAVSGLPAQEKPKRWIFISGLLAGLATLFRHDFGFYTFLSEISAILFFPFWHRKLTSGGKVSSNWASVLIASLWPYLLGFGAVLFFPLAFFLSAVPVKDLWYDLVTFPATIFPLVRDLPYPAPLPDPARIFRGELSFSRAFADLSHRWAFYIVPLTFAAVFFFLLFGNRRKPHPKGGGDGSAAWEWGVGVFLVFGILSFNNVRVRSDLPHLFPSFVAAGLLFPALVAKILELRLFRRGLVFGVGLAAALLLFPHPLQELQKPGVDERYRHLLYVHNLRRAGSIGVNPFQAQAIYYIQSVTFPWERIFVGSHRHDQIYNSDVIFYFLSERNCATRYHELSPGSATSREVQAAIIDDLQRNHVRYIVILSRVPIRGVTNEPVPVRLLDEFIKVNYQQFEKFGDWFVLKRR